MPVCIIDFCETAYAMLPTIKPNNSYEVKILLKGDQKDFPGQGGIMLFQMMLYYDSIITEVPLFLCVDMYLDGNDLNSYNDCVEDPFIVTVTAPSIIFESISPVADQELKYNKNKPVINYSVAMKNIGDRPLVTCLC